MKFFNETDDFYNSISVILFNINFISLKLANIGLFGKFVPMLLKENWNAENFNLINV